MTRYCQNISKLFLLKYIRVVSWKCSHLMSQECAVARCYVKKHVKEGNFDVKYGIKHSLHIYL